MYLVLKVLISAVLVAAISEAAKRSSVLGAFIASLPVTSLLAFIWLYLEMHDVQQVSALSVQIFWLVIPSLSFFLLLPLFLRLQIHFWVSLGLAMIGTGIFYSAMVFFIRYWKLPG